MRRAWRGVWWLSWLHDSLSALVFIVGGLVAVVVGLVTARREIAGLGVLAAVGGIVYGVLLARETRAAPASARRRPR